MSKELIAALDALEKENGISKEVMFEAIEKSLMDEYKTQFNTVENGRVVLDRITGDFHIYSDRQVVEEVSVPEPAEGSNSRKNTEKYISATEISLADARKIKPNCQIGDIVTVEVKSEEFSRRAAKNAKGTIVQKIREEEKAALYNEYHSKEKEIITGIVQRIDEKGNVLVDIGRTQTTLKVSDQVKGETFERGDRIKLYVVSVSNKEKPGTLVRVSRTSPQLVERLFEEEVTEIKDGIVEIMGIAREAGSRTKMATADDEEKKAEIIVSEQQLSLAIGKSGQNVRLAAKLTGFGIDIKSEAQANEDIDETTGDEEDVELTLSEEE